MTAVSAAEDGGAADTKRRRGRGRPRKDTHSGHPPPHIPVSRRSSRRPRQQLREDFYNVDGIVVDDDESDEFFRREDEDDDEDEEDSRSKKKLKLLLKLNSNPDNRSNPKSRRGSFSGSISSDEEDADEIRQHEDLGGRMISNGRSSTSGSGTPLPEMKTLELILDKIQKKDKYGVFAEPVDPEELPDYHEVIKNPMDFSTIRKKLARNLYSDLEQFESDILLLCSNAMQYNSPDTIYFKQASSMQELTKKKFHTVRARSNSYEVISNGAQRRTTSANALIEQQPRESSEKSIQHLEKIVIEKAIEDRPKSLADKPIEGRLKILINKPIEELPNSISDKPIENQANHTVDKTKEKSMCSSPELNATSVDSHDANFSPNKKAFNDLKNTEHVGVENQDCALVPSSPIHHQCSTEKTEEPLEKSLPSSQGKKPYSQDEERRATYSKSINQPSIEPVSLFATVESDKNLVAVGLHDESSYARSLARFSATLGPIAWKIASKHIEKALPAGLKFGPGWVGEYEPPIAPFFSREDYCQQVSKSSRDTCHSTELEKPKKNFDVPSNNKYISQNMHGGIISNGYTSRDTCQSKELEKPKNNFDEPSNNKNISQKMHGGTISNGHTTDLYHKTVTVLDKRNFSENTTEAKQALFGFPLVQQPPIRNDILQQQKSCIGNHFSDIHSSNKFDVPTYGRTMSNQGDFATANRPGYSDAGLSRTVDTGFRNSSKMKANSSKVENSMLGHENISRRAGNFPMTQDNNNPSEQKPNGSFGIIRSREVDNIRKSNPVVGTDQKIDDPVKLLKTLPGIVQNHPNPSLSNATEQFTSPVLLANNYSGAALNTTSQTWRSVKTPSEREPSSILSNSQLQPKNPTIKPTWMFPQSTPGFQEVMSRSFLKPNHTMVKDHPGFQNKGTVPYPHVFPAELPRFPGQSPWQSFIQHSQQRQRQSMLPPDLNIGFQSPGSPVQQPSNVLVDSQQPDLALQL